MTARRPGAMGECEARTQGALIAVAIGATEDEASRRPARPGDTGFILRRALKSLKQPLALDPVDLRGAAVALLAAGVVLPLLPGHPGIACPLRRLTGIPCPLCGMTTSVEQTLRLHLHAATVANPAGVLAVALAIALVVRRPHRLAVPALLPGLLLGAMWLFELHRFSIL